MRTKRQYYMTYLSQTHDNKFVGNIQFSNAGKLTHQKILEVVSKVKKTTQANRIVILNIIKI